MKQAKIIRNREQDYLSAVSYLSAAGSVGSASERLARFTECRTADTLQSACRDVFRLNIQGPDVYDAAITDAVDKLKSVCPDMTPFLPLLYKYDCTNAKIALKSAVSGAVCRPEDFFACGTVSREKLAAMCAERSYMALPEHMAASAAEADREYVKSGEVRAIDLLMDAACFADMAAAADAGGVELVRRIVTLRADAANTLASMRIKASGMPNESAAALMKRAYVPGGDMPLRTFTGDGCSDIYEINEKTTVGCLLKDALLLLAGDKNVSFIAAERQFDEAVLSECDKYRFTPFGPEVAVRFLLTREAEITNCRLIENGLRSGLKPEIIKERLRRAYV